MGHMLDSRAQLMACSTVVVMKLSSKRPSNQPLSFLQLRAPTRRLSEAYSPSLTRRACACDLANQYLVLAAHRQFLDGRPGGFLCRGASHPDDIAAPP